MGCVVNKHGNKYWYKNGKRHREDGPAVELAHGTKEWWLNGKLLTEEEFEKNMYHSCKHCGKKINIINDLFYTIGREPKRKNKIKNKENIRIFFFHPACFEEIAGKEYM